MEYKKRLLIISYYWPPTGGSGVQRWVKFSKYLPEHGWQPVIYTPENPERLAYDESLLADIPECTEVIRRRIVEPYGLYRKLFGRSGGEVNPLNSSGKSLKSKLSRVLRGNLFIPDPRVSWVRGSVRFLKKYLREHPVDAVVTTGPPQSMHLIGRGLKRSLGLPWIADFRDPWTRMFYYKHLCLSKFADRKHHRLEQGVLDEADLVLAVSPPVRDDFQAQTGTPVHLITNGYDEDDFPVREPGSRRDGKFRIVHTGLFAADGNPLKLWDALARRCREDEDFAQRLEIRLAGKTDAPVLEAIRERGLGAQLVDLGYLPHSRVVQEQQEADLLILPLRHEPEYAKVLPGKIFEYIASGRPVLGIGQEDGAAAAILRDSGAGRMYDWDREDKFLEFMDMDHEAAEGAARYSRKALTRQLVEELESLVRNNREI
ncbi:MAG: glycosyltransferase [Candidatus Cryptobacteroides sp.]|nr:glycosyltransferase [Rikenellaceae bacterium]MDY5746234.1 glycosyltransferase [Candidatus Cryptobacteroides sp.]